MSTSIFEGAHILAVTLSRPRMDKRIKIGNCVDNAGTFEAVVPDQTNVCCGAWWNRTTSRTKASDWGLHCWRHLLQQNDWYSLSACQALERDLPPTNVVSAANHPLSSSGYWAPSFQLCYFSSMCLCFKSTRDFLIHTNSQTTESRIIQLMPNCYTEWGYTGYELFIWFSALWIIVFSYLCLYWYQIPQVISLDLKCVSIHRKMSSRLIFWRQTKGCEHWPIQDSEVWFSQSAEGLFCLTRPLGAVDSALI